VAEIESGGRSVRWDRLGFSAMTMRAAMPTGEAVAAHQTKPHDGATKRFSQNAWSQSCGDNLSGTIIRGTLKTPNSQLVTPISTKLQRPDGCD
jgi:invasion protein IalB